jgi:uncharacterized alpha-E superfamily protein
MLSRVAEALYWMSRYVERAENVARFIDVNFNLMLDTPVRQRTGWQSLVMTTGDSEWYERHHGSYGPNEVGWFLTFDKSYANSLLSSVVRARENAQTIREVISREMWEQLNEIYLTVREASRRPYSLDDLGEFYRRLKVSGVHYEGVTNATLSRGEAWNLTRLGRLIERADKTSRILDVQYYNLLPGGNEVSGAVDPLGWTALLSSASALQMYRQVYHSMAPQHVVDFLLLGQGFPRSILYCLAGAQQSLHAITGTPSGACHFEVERLLGKLRSQLNYATMGEIMELGLHQYIDQLQISLNQVGEHVSAQFFH